jgi:phosphoglycolate phosphatase-like HAD superfamily hydrolase
VKLALFDIDGTLVLTGGAGGRAMAQAFRDVFGLDHGMPSISMAGRTDAWIVAQMAVRHGLACDDEVLRRFHGAYVGYLGDEIHKPGPQKGILPGVRETLDALAGHDGVHLALLTGNFERGAQIKLEYFGLWDYFQTGAFGDATHDRNSLLHEAIERVARAGGPRVHPRDAVVVGDTPLDVAVAVAGGARSLAVATGGYAVEALLASGADAVLENLTDREAVLRGLGLAAAGPDMLRAGRER